ncbi:hypothetical protein BsWGS_12337 [Bradybaena similaris]
METVMQSSPCPNQLQKSVEDDRLILKLDICDGILECNQVMIQHRTYRQAGVRPMLVCFPYRFKVFHCLQTASHCSQGTLQSVLYANDTQKELFSAGNMFAVPARLGSTKWRSNKGIFSSIKAKFSTPLCVSGKLINYSGLWSL